MMNLYKSTLRKHAFYLLNKFDRISPIFFFLHISGKITASVGWILFAIVGFNVSFISSSVLGILVVSGVIYTVFELAYLSPLKKQIDTITGYFALSPDSRKPYSNELCLTFYDTFSGTTYIHSRYTDKEEALNKQESVNLEFKLKNNLAQSLA